LSALDAGEDVPFGIWAIRWRPDGEKLVTDCNPVSKGQYGEEDLCLLNAQSGIEKIFPYQRHWTPSTFLQFSSDGNYLYYYLKSSEFVYPAKLYRLDIRDGHHELVLEGLRDYSWIYSSEIREYYDFKRIKWSPDGTWMILNSSGPEEKLWPDERQVSTTALLCDPTNVCQEMKFGPLVILGADWWIPPASWNPGNPMEEINRDLGEVAIEDEFSSVDAGNWNTSGDISLTTSEYGAAVKLDGNEEQTSFKSKFDINPHDGVIFDIRYDQKANFYCGLYSRTGRNRLFIYGYPETRPLAVVNVFLFGVENVEGKYVDYADYFNINRWKTVFLRIVNNNQLQVLITDKALNAKISGFNVKLDGDWSATPYYFGCEVFEGVIELNRFNGLAFP